jgi:hypoxanthine phosphoribosyltransferase
MAEPDLSPITHEDFVADVHAVARALAEVRWTPDHIVGIGRGGLVPAAYLSHRTGISLLSVDHSSGVPGFADELMVKLAAATRAGQRLLLVDDINDSGLTISTLRRALGENGADMARVRVAVLIDNVRSAATSDYRARTIDREHDKRWFVFPWEAMAGRDILIGAAKAVPERLA